LKPENKYRTDFVVGSLPVRERGLKHPPRRDP
jgi:hypothetical protein